MKISPRTAKVSYYSALCLTIAAQILWILTQDNQQATSHIPDSFGIFALILSGLFAGVLGFWGLKKLFQLTLRIKIALSESKTVDFLLQTIVFIFLLPITLIALVSAFVPFGFFEVINFLGI